MKSNKTTCPIDSQDFTHSYNLICGSPCCSALWFYSLKSHKQNLRQWMEDLLKYKWINGYDIIRYEICLKKCLRSQVSKMSRQYFLPQSKSICVCVCVCVHAYVCVCTSIVIFTNTSPKMHDSLLHTNSSNKNKWKHLSCACVNVMVKEQKIMQ